MEGYVDGTYELRQRLGAGNFGEIRLCRNVNTDKTYAIKMESVKAKSPQLHLEFQYYKQLCPKEGIPNIYFFGVHGLQNVLVLDLLGPSLESHFDSCGRSFSVKKVALFAVQLIPLIEYVHSKGIVYRDVKPDNFLLGLGEKAQIVHIVDFGLSKEFRDSTGAHIPFREQKHLTGTARYMSINTHKGREQSRRDDLEAIAHMLFYFLRGHLPWQGLHADTVKERYHLIGQKKSATTVQQLCRDLPDQFAQLLSYSRNLQFDEDPHYAHLQDLMAQVRDSSLEHAPLEALHDRPTKNASSLKSRLCCWFRRKKK